MLTGTCQCRIRGFHPLWPAFPDRFAIDGFVTPQCFRNPALVKERFGLFPLSLAATYGIDVSFFSSRYLDVSVPWVRFYTPIHSACDDSDTIGNAFPHSDISGSMLVCQLPGAYRRLPRLSSPLDAKASTTHP
jgi:hypothetical protein